ncbi:MAG: hypothetical protein WBC51_05925, partial [Vicinamibacterales bacterium]
LLDRLFYVLLFGMPWWIIWFLLGAAADSVATILFFGSVPWLFLVLDTIIDSSHTNGDLRGLMAGDDVVLATRAEYVGGHPELPHGRFAYLTIRGDRENPMLTLTFPEQSGPGRTFDVPLLDIGKTKPEATKEEGLADSILASLSEKPGRLFRERVTLVVDYQGPGGRKHKVELTSFFRGNDEIRNWRNYLVCAQAEADTGVTPYGPWKSLRPVPATEEAPDDASRDGSKLQPARRAFERR